MSTLTKKSKLLSRVFAICIIFVYTCSFFTYGIKAAEISPQFKVIAFYNGTWDAAHISFVKEANRRFPEFASQYNFSYESTNDWSKLNTAFLSQYKVVIFLDDAPPAAQRPAFEQYMKNGGGWLGFHVSAFNQNPSQWSWYYNEFLGTGAFKSNTWFPTPAVLRVENSTHPATRDLPTTFKTPANEWYSWSVDLRTKPNIDILCSIDPASFPLGTDPNQSWYSGYYPVVWSNKDYKMMYVNMGHNAMDYASNTAKSYTFSNETQNKLIINALLWMGGGKQTTPPPSGTNLALNKPVTFSGEQVGNEAIHAVDGDTTNRWSAQVFPQWINVDLGAVYNVNKTEVVPYMDRAYQFKVEVSTDGTNYTQVVDRTANTTGGALIADTFTGTNARYVKLTVTGCYNDATTWASINEFRVFGDTSTPMPTPTPTPTPTTGYSYLTAMANQSIVSADNYGNDPLVANRTSAGDWELFQIINNSDGTISLLSKVNGKYVCADLNQGAKLIARSSAIDAWEKFKKVTQADGTVTLQAMANNQYVSCDLNQGAVLYANRAAVGGTWEAFTIVSGPATSPTPKT